MGHQEIWLGYLDQFHAERPGITERVLRRCWLPLHPACGGTTGGEPAGLDPYEWLAAQAGSGSSVVDLACGSAPLYRELGGSHAYLGVDRSIAELRLAAERGTPVAQADATRLPIATSSVETVVSSMALMLLPVGEALREVARVLRPGGCFAATVPATGPLTAADRFTYARLRLALRTAPLRLPHAAGLAALRPGRFACGLRVVHDERQRFSYPLVPGAGELLLDSLYLPELSERTRRKALRVVTRWTGGGLGVPLRLLVMTKGN